MTRAEWISSAAFFFAAASIVYSAGIETQRLNDLDRRLTAVEASYGVTAAKVERIDANVTLLVEEEKERREREK